MVAGVAKRKNKPVAAGKKKPNDWPARLKALREELGGMSQEEAAGKIHVTRQAWINWENGHTIPSPPFALLLNKFIESPKSF